VPTGIVVAMMISGRVSVELISLSRSTAGDVERCATEGVVGDDIGMTPSESGGMLKL
jgi:hypothetical protein